MQEIKLLSAFGGIDEKYVLEAEQPFPKKRTYPVGRWGAIAAGICLALGLAFAVRGIVKYETFLKEKKGGDCGQLILSETEGNSSKENTFENLEEWQNTSIDDGMIRDFDTFDSSNSKELQKIDPSGHFSGDLGMGTLTAKEASDLIDNPAGASEEISAIKTMPVYKRKKRMAVYDYDFNVLSEDVLSEEEIEEGEEYLTEIAERLGLELKTIERETNVLAEGTQVVSLTAECEQGTLELNAEDLYVDALKFVPKQGQETEDFVTETMRRLQCVSGFSQTKTFIWQDYDYDGGKHCLYYGYEGEGSLKEQIQNCALSRLRCYPQEDGSIGSIWLEHYRKNTICLGEYPIISRKKAEKLLFQGKYLSRYCENFPADAKVAACELTYVPEINSQVMIPYYSFLVEVPGEQEDEELGLKTFAEFYVPAVKEKYFKDSFQWEFAVD